jgi:hypothetical protein
MVRVFLADRPVLSLRERAAHSQLISDGRIAVSDLIASCRKVAEKVNGLLPIN